MHLYTQKSKTQEFEMHKGVRSYFRCRPFFRKSQTHLAQPYNRTLPTLVWAENRERIDCKPTFATPEELK